MRTDWAVYGHVEPGFEAVRAALEENFEHRGEWGCSFCVWHDGRLVADLWGGIRDRAAGLPFWPDTLATAFSSTKGLVALCFLMLAERGLLDYDAPIATYWPSFAKHGKGSITVRMLLNHRAGLIGLDRDLPLSLLAKLPSDEAAGILEEQRPSWDPGSDQGYHAITYGLYAGELFRRIAKQTLGSFLQKEVAGPLGADVYLGLPRALESRVAKNHPATGFERIFRIVPAAVTGAGTEGRVFRSVLSGGDAAKAFAFPSALGPRGIDNFNSPDVHAMELPWGNGIASARGLCRVYSALANGGAIDGVRLVHKGAIESLAERQSWSESDRVLHKPLGWSQGFLKEQVHLFSPNTESFGHPGAGGPLGWCDPVARVAMGYVTTKMAHHIRSPRAVALAHSVYECLGTVPGSGTAK